MRPFLALEPLCLEDGSQLEVKTVRENDVLFNVYSGPIDHAADAEILLNTRSVFQRVPVQRDVTQNKLRVQGGKEINLVPETGVRVVGKRGHRSPAGTVQEIRGFIAEIQPELDLASGIDKRPEIPRARAVVREHIGAECPGPPFPEPAFAGIIYQHKRLSPNLVAPSVREAVVYEPVKTVLRLPAKGIRPHKPKIHDQRMLPVSQRPDNMIGLLQIKQSGVRMIVFHGPR